MSLPQLAATEHRAMNEGPGVGLVRLVGVVGKVSGLPPAVAALVGEHVNASGGGLFARIGFGYSMRLIVSGVTTAGDSTGRRLAYVVVSAVKYDASPRYPIPARANPMRAAIANLFCVLLLTNYAQATDAEPQPHLLAAPPRLTTVAAFDEQEGELTIASIAVRFVWESIPGETGSDGDAGPSQGVCRRPVFETRGWTMALDAATFFDASGAKLTTDEIADRIKVGSVVAVSVDGNAVDPAYLAALAKETLVIVSPEYAVNNVEMATDAPAFQPPLPATPQPAPYFHNPYPTIPTYPQPAYAPPIISAPAYAPPAYTPRTYATPNGDSPDYSPPVVEPSTPVAPVIPAP
jgi:hypothetical protein